MSNYVPLPGLCLEFARFYGKTGDFKLNFCIENSNFSQFFVSGIHIYTFSHNSAGKKISSHRHFKHEEDIHSSYYDLSPASKDVNTTPLSPAHLSEQTSVVQPDESAETSSQGTVTGAMQDTETEQDPIIISTQR